MGYLANSSDVVRQATDSDTGLVILVNNGHSYQPANPLFGD